MIRRSFAASVRSGLHVEQNGAGVADQSVGPACDHAGTNDAHQRVDPEPAEGAGEQQAQDDEHGDGGVREDVNDRGAHVVVAPHISMRVVVVVPMVVAVRMAVLMIMVVFVVVRVAVVMVGMMLGVAVTTAEQPRARDIDREAENGDRDRFVEMDRNRNKEA